MAAKETKTVTLRLPVEMVEYLTRNDDSINQAVINEISNLKRIRLVSMGELRGLFTPQEWIFIADSFNGTIVDDFMRANVGVFIAGCEDSERFEGKASIHGVDLQVFLDKVKTLKGANIEAIYSRVEDFWNHCNEIELEEWAKF